jgi:hypothetical protein
MRLRLPAWLMTLAVLAAWATAPNPVFGECPIRTLQCGTQSVESLDSDCETGPAMYRDLFHFAGEAGKIVQITARPLSSTPAQLFIELTPPTGSEAKRFRIDGPTGVTVNHVLSGSGLWTVAVGSPIAWHGGEYLLEIECYDDPAPELPELCMWQTVLCGQTVRWHLTAQSCPFADDQARTYHQYIFYGLKGDVLRLDYNRDNFVLTIYDNSYNFVRSGIFEFFPLPQEGFYRFILTSRRAYGFGPYSLRLLCRNSGCLKPAILQQPAETTVVRYGERAVLEIKASAVPEAQYTWTNTDGVSIGNGSKFTTPPVLSPQTYIARAANPCGTAVSRPITVEPDILRRRPVRR